MSSLNNWLGALFFLCSIDGFYEPWGTNQPQHTKTQKTSNIRSFEEIGCWKTAATNSKCGTVDGRNPAPPGTYKNLNCIERDMIEKKMFLTKSLTLRQTSMWREGTTTNSCFFCNRQRYPPPPPKKKNRSHSQSFPPPKKKTAEHSTLPRDPRISCHANVGHGPDSIELRDFVSKLDFCCAAGANEQFFNFLQ